MNMLLGRLENIAYLENERSKNKGTYRMKRKLFTVCLLCAWLLTTVPTGFAVRLGGNGMAPQPVAGTGQAERPVHDTLSFSQISSQIQSSNLNVLSVQEGLLAAEAFDRDKAYNKLKDTIDDMTDTIWTLTTTSGKLVETVVGKLTASTGGVGAALSQAQGSLTGIDSAALTAVGNAAAQKAYLMVQIDNMKAAVESMEDQLDALKKEEYQKTLTDTKRMVASTVAQIVSGAESLYITILSTELQLDSLKDTLEMTKRSVRELELRYERGQISKLTLKQVQQAHDSLASSVSDLENTLETMYTSLRYMLGDTAERDWKLMPLPLVSTDYIDSISYEDDLKIAKERSYAVYSAGRTLENAAETWKEAKKDHGKNTYEYKMAEHTYQSAVYQHDASIQNFELSFLNAYQALIPARNAWNTAESAYTYQEAVYASAELKYKLGKLSANALAEEKNTLESAARDVTAAETKLFSLWNAYSQAVEFGLVSG